MKSPFPGMDPYLSQYWTNICSSLLVYTADQLNHDLPESLVARTDKPMSAGRKRFIVGIRDRNAAHRVVTVIEFQSPGHEVASADEETLKREGSSFVEIDLHIGRFQARVRRASNWSAVEVLPFCLREHLPRIPIPLPAGEDVELRLQSIIDRAYRIGRFDTIDYQPDPDSPVEKSDAAWVDSLLRKAGKRK